MPDRKRPTTTPDRERRLILRADLRVERRAAAEGGDAEALPQLVGHASVFNQWTTLYDGDYFTWREIVRPGAFRNALAEKQDVLACIDHNRSKVLGRSTSGTLQLAEDETGLLSTIDTPDVSYARDLLVLLERQDIVGMSFAFCVRPGGEKVTITMQDDKELEERELLDLDLLDVSVVTDPAYPQTDISVRSIAAIAELRDKPRQLPRDPWLNRAWARLRLAEAE